MTRQRAVQGALVLVGLLYLSWFIPLFQALWHSRWIQENLEDKTMFVSVNMVLGILLLLAVRKPADHRSLIAFGAWSSVAHASTMAIQTVEARAHGIPRSPLDVVVIGAVGIVLLAVVVTLREPKHCRPVPIGEPRFADAREIISEQQ
jgi:hypothetical protein